MFKNVTEYLDLTESEYPDKIALVDEHDRITFSELKKRAQSVANLIQLRCKGLHNSPIAVYMDKGISCIIAFLGILYSGNHYTPIDTGTPAERVNKILDVLKPKMVLIADSKPGELFKDYCCLDISEATDIPPLEYVKPVISSDPAYVLFTSGSTGYPKGVVVSHQSIIDYIEWLKEEFGFDENTVFGNQAPFHFDNSILDIYSTIKNASTMVIIPEHLFSFPQKLLGFMISENINTVFWVPSALVSVANSGVLDELKVPRLNKILFCGEVMPNRQLNIWRRQYPQALFANLYGPTEITDVCSFYIVNREFADEEPLPIGRACKNTEIIILNEKNQLVAENELGELCVRGIGVSLGYYCDEEKSNKVFVQNPLHQRYRDIIYRTGDLVRYNTYGEIEYVGRKDFQIKHQGHRIELGEIESNANAIPGVEQSCAIYDEAHKQIKLYIVSKQENYEKTVYSDLKEKLPRYMLPARIISKSELPLNINGKIDRITLMNE